MASIKAHTSIIGHTGYNIHARNFFKELNSLIPVSVRNWTIGPTWKGYASDEPHNDEPYLDDTLKRMLTEQTLGTDNGHQDFPLYTKWQHKLDEPVINIVLNDNRHPYFDQDFRGYSIAYNVWETTRQPDDFFNKLKKFDQVWVPSEWQKQCTIEQGIPADRVKVVPEGVDIDRFKPIDLNEETGPKTTKFLVVGRWEYRKATREIIESFLKAFPNDQTVELYLKVDNPFASDGLTSTEQRLDKFKLTDPRIKIVNQQSQEEYVELLQSCDVFVSCSRGEGWNLPLIEAMACGIPAIYSSWGAQLEFANGHGLPVKIKEEIPAAVSNDESWDSSAPGNFAEPNFDHLVYRLIEAKEHLPILKNEALETSNYIRKTFTWQNAASIAYRHIQELISPKMYEHSPKFNWVTCGNLGYMPIIEKLVQSLDKFSSNKILVYGIDCEVPFAEKYPNVIAKKLTIEPHSIHDKWYWKQYACLDSLETEETRFIWIDGDVIANYNIDSLAEYFDTVTNVPLPDVHVQKDFIGYYENSDGTRGQQLFNEELNNKMGIPRLSDKAHICLYLYNTDCKWWFEEILKEYKSTPVNDYPKLLTWNDEGIDNYLRSKYQETKMLPVSNFDVSEWDGDLLGTTGKAMEHFISFWRDSGPINFGKIYGWQYVPADKSQIKYFHGNKNLEFAQFMIDYIDLQRSGRFHDSKLFFTGKNEVKDLGRIHGVPGSTMQIAETFGWDYAIYHEIYNLEDYQFGNYCKIKPGDTVVDLGGNIGVFTRYAYHMGAKRIITFEPDRRYFEILKQNAPANTILFNAAVGDSLGKLTLTESQHLGGSNLWQQPDPRHTQYQVNTYTLDHLFKTGLIDSIDFLKVDIEGSEIIALNGISDENLSRVRNIAVEYHHEHLGFDDSLRDGFIARLNRLGFNSHMLLCGTNNALQLIYFWK